jgi:hypothetical protein
MKQILFSVILGVFLFITIPSAGAIDRYREMTTPYMSNERISVDFQIVANGEPVPQRIELIVKNTFIGFATPTVTGNGFRFEMNRGCRDPLYPGFDYISDYRSYGYLKNNVKYVFILPGSVRIEEFGEFPIVLREPNGYIDTEKELSDFCKINVTGGTTQPPVSGDGDSFLSPLFDLIANIIKGLLGAIFGN